MVEKRARRDRRREPAKPPRQLPPLPPPRTAASSAAQRAFALNLVSDALADPAAFSFSKPVHQLWDMSQLPDYAARITRPIDLGTIHASLSDGAYLRDNFFDVNAMRDDLRRVFWNAMDYNPRGADLHKVARRLLQFVDDRLRLLPGLAEEKERTNKNSHNLAQPTSSAPATSVAPQPASTSPVAHGTATTPTAAASPSRPVTPPAAKRAPLPATAVTNAAAVAPPTASPPTDTDPDPPNRNAHPPQPASESKHQSLPPPPPTTNPSTATSPNPRASTPAAPPAPAAPSSPAAPPTVNHALSAKSNGAPDRKRDRPSSRSSPPDTPAPAAADDGGGDADDEHDASDDAAAAARDEERHLRATVAARRKTRARAEAALAELQLVRNVPLSRDEQERLRDEIDALPWHAVQKVVRVLQRHVDDAVAGSGEKDPEFVTLDLSAVETHLLREIEAVVRPDPRERKERAAVDAADRDIADAEARLRALARDAVKNRKRPRLAAA